MLSLYYIRKLLTPSHLRRSLCIRPECTFCSWQDYIKIFLVTLSLFLFVKVFDAIKHDLLLKPVLTWANVCSRTYLEVFGEPSWFLTGRTFLREPSWKHSSNCDEVIIIRDPKSFAQHVLGTFALFDEHCLCRIGWEQSSPVDEGEIKTIKMDDGVARFFTRFGGNLFIYWLVGGAALSRGPRMR